MEKNSRTKGAPEPKIRLVRVTTVPISLEKLLTGQMQFMADNGFEVFMISSPYENYKDLEHKEKSSYVAVEMSRVISPFKDLISLFRMYKALRALKPDIIHTHTPKAGLIGMLAAWLARVPVRLHTVAGLPLMEARGIKRVILEIAEKLTYFCAVKIYPNSNNLKNFILERRYSSPKKLKVIGNGSSNGIDSSFFKRDLETDNQGEILRGLHQLSPQDFLFVFIGRIVKDKGIEELIAAFSRLSKLQQYSNVKLLLVGPEERELDPLSIHCLDEIERNNSIIHVGYQANVKPYLSISNALVFPSYREGFPNVPMQAGCFDLPSIVTNINGCNEIVADYVNGIIIPVKNEEALFIAMERLVADTELYNKLQANARKMVTDRYEQKKIWNTILNEYIFLLGIENHVQKYN